MIQGNMIRADTAGDEMGNRTTDMDNLSTKTDIQSMLSEMKAELKVLKFAVFTLYPFVLAITYRIFS